MEKLQINFFEINVVVFAIQLSAGGGGGGGGEILTRPSTFHYRAPRAAARLKKRMPARQ
jgi:hypothetical protein